MLQNANQIECDAILFDLDGVLIDSTSCIVRHWNEWADRHGLDIDKILQVAHGTRTIETIRSIAPHLDAQKEADDFTAHEVADTDGVVAIEGAYQTVRPLPQDAWAIVTSGSLDLVKARLAKAGLPIPATLVTADDVIHGKPAPEPYLVGAQRLGIPAERCVVIEDAPAGIEAGKKAGMRVIGITATHTREELLAHGADVVVEKLTGIAICETDGEYRLAIRTK